MRTCFILFVLLLLTIAFAASVPDEGLGKIEKNPDELITSEDAGKENIARVYLRKTSRVKTELRFYTKRKPKLT